MATLKKGIQAVEWLAEHLVISPLLWNQVQEADSLSIFKIRLKTFLFEKADNQ